VATHPAERGHDELIPPPVELLGVGIHPVSAEQLVDLIIRWGIESSQRRISYVNVHAMNLAVDDDLFRFALNTADLVFCDGYGVKWAGQLVGKSIPHRLTPPDWIDAFASSSLAAGQAVFAIGDEEGVAARFQTQLCERQPGYIDAGSHHGFFRKEGSENDAVIETINRSGATHLLVGFGMPLQEIWLEQYASRLRPRVLMSVGALFRWYSQVERRAPRWVTDHGMEWLSRFARHPIRHFRRYAVGNPLFLMRVLHSHHPFGPKS
jgi:N-acetylglucosaminyldiphosphoundecaprenol N-acetyl-beta-D-mannosaminyltransferase